MRRAQREGKRRTGRALRPGPRDALAKALEIAAELGLDTHNAGSYIGWAETGSIARGQKFLATITHTDVVPEGTAGTPTPTPSALRDGWLLGRGVADDKGPSILCLYALKYLKDSGAALRYPVRALLGANEETGMLDVDYYAEHFEMPAFCFTPDAEFPVCNGEKGGFNGEIVSPVLEGGVILDFAGGVAPQRRARPRLLRGARGGGRLPPRRGRDRGGQRRRHRDAARLGQERPCGHAPGHRQRYRPAGKLPAGKRRLHRRPRAAYLQVLQIAACLHRRQLPGHCGGRRPV